MQFLNVVHIKFQKKKNISLVCGKPVIPTLQNKALIYELVIYLKYLDIMARKDIFRSLNALISYSQHCSHRKLVVPFQKFIFL
jgi:hypothetical protein